MSLPRIGFGTAALGRSLSARERLAVLETAFDCGLTHFDTAPLYGGGAAEQALGALGRRDQITIATKVGIRPAPIPRLTHPRGGLFSPADVRASLAKSLRRLRTDHVDVVLLHEVTPESVDEALLETLADLIRRGDARAAGIATGWARSEPILARGGSFPEVVQLAAEADPPPLPGRTLVLHSAIVRRAGAPGALLLAAAERHAQATVLFGSRRTEHVRETATAVASLL